MLNAPASDVAKNFGEWHDKAMVEPIVVTKHGRESVVLLSMASYRSLLRNYREIIDTAELDDIVAHGVETSDIPPEYRWNSDDEDVSDERRGAGQ
ncbi:MAG TPA: type II toxin-antitoxin system prevent-host-death family antitoxin [Devosia sp.]|jgi:antitoxin StbD|nr:type II toxin-antitoxin system prevent-host-death family antitoxin [Devosia sp.]